jgi:hypothetical protein
VYPQRLIYIGRRFGTLHQVHLQRLETSANINQTLGIHPKIETVNTEHSESLKSRILNTLIMFPRFLISGYYLTQFSGQLFITCMARNGQSPRSEGLVHMKKVCNPSDANCVFQTAATNTFLDQPYQLSSSSATQPNNFGPGFLHDMTIVVSKAPVLHLSTPTFIKFHLTLCTHCQLGSSFSSPSSCFFFQ